MKWRQSLTYKTFLILFIPFCLGMALSWGQTRNPFGLLALPFFFSVVPFLVFGAALIGVAPHGVHVYIIYRLIILLGIFSFGRIFFFKAKRIENLDPKDSSIDRSGRWLGLMLLWMLFGFASLLVAGYAMNLSKV